MAKVECRSAQRGVASTWVELENITDAQADAARDELDERLDGDDQISTTVALVFVELTRHCPKANPSDLWQHIIYRHLLDSGWSDQRWKRVSGFALERALVATFQPRLIPHGVRMRILSSAEANDLLGKLGIKDIKSTKVDLFLEGRVKDSWVVFGAAHAKSSIAERIQDDVPASRSFMELGLTSIALTMDAKSYPPPHGNCINYGELGGRSAGVDKERLKRRYVEVDGQFDALFSFNLRTPPSPKETESGKRIFTMLMHEDQPDQLVSFVTAKWNAYAKSKAL